MARDRDRAGRPRNARPRDAAGRPLPRDAAGVQRIPDDLELTPEETLDRAQQLLDDGLPFPAHDVLEAAWKAAAEPERELWRGLAQLAVGLTHVQRGNATGAVSLLRRGAENLESFSDDPPHGVAVPGVIAAATGLADVVERDGVPETLPRIRLRQGSATVPSSPPDVTSG